MSARFLATVLRNVCVFFRSNRHVSGVISHNEVSGLFCHCGALTGGQCSFGNTFLNVRHVKTERNKTRVCGYFELPHIRKNLQAFPSPKCMSLCSNDTCYGGTHLAKGNRRSSELYRDVSSLFYLHGRVMVHERRELDVVHVVAVIAEEPA